MGQHQADQRLYYRGLRREEKEKVAENVFEEVTAENFPNLGKETDIQVQEAQRVPNNINLKTHQDKL